LKTPIRRLEGITYWVIEDPDAIHDFMNNELQKEWEEDARTEHRDPTKDTWLKTLSKRPMESQNSGHRSNQSRSSNNGL
jgi:hypothetical protein